ncbi:MAG: deaminase [bacterium]
MTQINYPYLPECREFKFVSIDDPMMQQAAQAREKCAGDRMFPVGAILVRDGKILCYAGNGYNRGSDNTHVCPRVVHECPSGEGYDLCSFHDSPGHAEQMVINVAREQGIETEGADLYMFGHWWACKSCWDYMIDAGVRDVYLAEGANELFSRDRVFAETKKSNIKQAYIAGGLTNLSEFGALDKFDFYAELGKVCDELGVTPRIPHIHNEENEKVPEDKDPKQIFEWASNEARVADVTVAEVTHPSLGTGGEIVIAGQCGKPVVLMSKKGTLVSRFAIGNPAVVYHIEYETPEEACKMLKYVLKQL